MALPLMPQDERAEIAETVRSRIGFGEMSLIQSYNDRSAYLVAGDNGKFVLKVHGSGSREFKREVDCLRFVTRRSYRYLRFPKVVEWGASHVLMGFLEREIHTNDSIAQKQWSEEDYTLWVKALLELQSISLPSSHYSLRHAIKASLYPLRTITRFAKRTERPIMTRQRLALAALLARYHALCPFFAFTTTHYDLHEDNFTFCLTEPRMAVLDFSPPVRKGDPFFDVCYYISRPRCRIDDWTFQLSLLREFIGTVRTREQGIVGLYDRLRMNLVLCNIGRYITCIPFAKWQLDIYSENIDFLLCDRSYDRFFSAALQA